RPRRWWPWLSRGDGIARERRSRSARAPIWRIRALGARLSRASLKDPSLDPRWLAPSSFPGLQPLSRGPDPRVRASPCLPKQGTFPPNLEQANIPRVYLRKAMGRASLALIMLAPLGAFGTMRA